MISLRKEVEIKLRVDGNISSKIEKMVSDPYEELDEYFFSSKEMIDKRLFLRFRGKRGKIFLELKALSVGGKQAKIYESDEIETEITKEQYNEMKGIFNAVFPIKVQVRKTRSKAFFNGCELCYDKIDDLGQFLEIEGEKEKIIETCNLLDIDMEKHRDTGEGYAIMTLRKKGLYD